MMFETQQELQNELLSIASVSDQEIKILNHQQLHDSFIDHLITTAIFSPDDELKTTARTLITKIASATGAHSSSIYPLYQAFGKGELEGFTIPAVNIRTLTYDTARLIFRLMMKHQIGAVVFEIARSEIEYTEQRPEEYTASVLAAAIKEGYTGPIFLQGDHYQFSKSKFEKDKDAEIQRLKDLIHESIMAQFFNIDIDASTLVDLSKNDLSEQQKNNYEMTALLTDYIRSLQPAKQHVSIGAEIGHIGGKNSTTDDFEAFIKGFQAMRPVNELSKISVQTGSSHGGSVLPDGSIQEVAIDFSVLKNISNVARQHYQIGGAVQHGASTLPLSYFDNFVASDTLEIHLATGFQNIVYDTLPQDLRDEIYSWIKEHLATEKEDGWNEEQFIYKTRKKAFGPFKQLLWDLSPQEKAPIGEALEKQFTTIFEKLRIFNTKEKVASYVS